MTSPPEGPVPPGPELPCFAAFRDFVGVPYGKSRLEPYVMYPQANSWRLLDDHEVTCAVGEPGHLTTGRLEGSRR